MTDTPHTNSHDAPHDPVAADIEERNTDSGDIVAGEQVLDEGHVSPNQDDFADDGASAEHGVNDSSATDVEREQAADERTDEGAPPPQPEPPG